MMKIALCDQDRIATEDIVKLLHEIAQEYTLDLEIFPFCDCEGCVSFMQQEAVDVLFTEMQLPEINGISLAEKLRKSSKNKEFVLVYISSFNGMAEETYAVKTRDYLLKPVKKARLIKALQKCDII